MSRKSSPAPTLILFLQKRVSLFQVLLFWLFALTILLFPFGQVFRVLLPALCLVPLLVLYSADWPNRNLRHLPVVWLWLVFFGLVALEIVTSSWMDVSWKAVRPNIFRGFILPFVAIECIRGEKDLRRLVGIFVLAALAEGLNGLWQFGTGTDFITGTAPLGGAAEGFIPGAVESLRAFRLTGSMSTYRVGNYMALMLLPACGLFVLWQAKGKRRSVITSALLTICLLSPALFLWIGAQARAGYLALVCGLYLVWLLTAKPGKLALIIPVMAGLAAILFGPDRITLASALADERRLIWATALECIKAHPVMGTGADTFLYAAKALGITHLPNGATIAQHPHNIYIQWLIDGGIVGFAGMSLWAFGLLVWVGRRVWQGLHHGGRESESVLYWRLVAFFWAGWAGYLINGLAAHGFYRTWWVSTAFSIIGIALGACANANRVHKTQAAL